VSIRHTMKVYWREIRPNEGIMAHWAELGHALLRLKFAVSEFEEGMSNLKDLQSIYRVHYQLENYYARVYEFSERLFSFMAAFAAIDMNKVKRMLQDPNQQAKLLSALPKSAKASITPLKRIIKVLHDDIETRHVHTHKTFIRLALNEGPHWVDIEDLWWEFEENAVTMGKAFNAMGKQGMRLVKEYKSRTEYIDKNLNAFLKAMLTFYPR
jgi:hypothetical protein